MSNVKDLLIENPIIAAVRSEEELQSVLSSSVKIVFVLYGSILNIKTIAEKLHDHNKSVFVHIDLIEGLKNDEAGIQFIKQNACPIGIITTKYAQIKYAKSLSLFTILRLFIIDTKSLATGIKNAEDVKPDAIEIMPGASSKIISLVEKSIKVPIVAGGLIETKEEVIQILNSGAVAISTTQKNIWEL